MLLKPSVMIPLATTTIGTQAPTQPTIAKPIQYKFSTTRSPIISKTEPNLDCSFRALATTPSNPSNITTNKVINIEAITKSGRPENINSIANTHKIILKIVNKLAIIYPIYLLLLDETKLTASSALTFSPSIIFSASSSILTTLNPL